MGIYQVGCRKCITSDFLEKKYHGRRTYQSISSVIFVSALQLCDSRKNSKKWVTIVSKRENRVHLFVLGRV